VRPNRADEDIRVHVSHFPLPADSLVFSNALASVCAELSSAAAISREPGRLRAVIHHAGQRVEVGLSGTALCVRSSSCILGNRILCRLNAEGGAWRHEDPVERERAVETIVFPRDAAGRRRAG
jgi:uncharacterized Fe-S cluster protein YjdI